MDNQPLIQLSDKLIRHIRNRLFFQYRFLEPALYRLEIVPMCIIPDGYGTDGEYLYYDPEAFVRRYRDNSIAEMRRFLHSVFHCIYLHPFTPVMANNDIWGLACDITVEASIMMQLGEFALPGDEERMRVIKQIQKDVTLLTTQEVIAYLHNHTTELNRYRLMFHFDNHLWMHGVKRKKNGVGDEKEKQEKELNRAKDYDEGNQKSDEPGNRNADDEDSERGNHFNGETKDENTNDENSESQNTSDCTGIGQMGGGSDGSEDDENEKGMGMPDFGMKTGNSLNRADEWKEAARRISMDMKAFSGQGSGRGLIEQNIDYLTRDEMDYEDFLEQFAIIEEVVQIDPDEFDYMYYMYGLSMPGPKKLLIEPLEYRDAKRIREFVIAIDTSGSCAGDLVNKFLTKTYSILKSTESFSSKVNIHIIQCDAEIQEHKRISKLEEIEEYARNLTIKGCGGTDFRPVFEYVEELIKKHEIIDLNGLIYFTDGYGTYPEMPTTYKTAFVFLEQYEERLVPPWAMRVYWKENEYEH